MMKYVSVTLGILVLIATVTFALQNLGSVEVSFLVWTATIPKIILILGTYFLGMLTGWGFIELAKRLF
jgi:uncharacterized integral membrane protein